jgi:hypothetical protein
LAALVQVSLLLLGARKEWRQSRQMQLRFPFAASPYDIRRNEFIGLTLENEILQVYASRIDEDFV